MFYVYILENDKKSKYIGYSTDLRRRLEEHNSGRGAKTTREGDFWKLIYYEAYVNQSDAIGREKFLKSGSGWRYIKKQLRHYLGIDQDKK